MPTANTYTLVGERTARLESDAAIIKKEIVKAKAETNARFDAVEERIDKVEGRLTERIEANARIMAHGLRDTNAKIDSVKEELGAKIDGVNGRIDALDTKIDGVRDGLNAKIDGVRDGLNGRMDALDAKIDALDAKFDGKFSDLHALILKVLENQSR
ncbi:hypothetical protein AGMMS50229_06350 [Campylobacterota bacterium]|nr:hypothetical protein AGMMS50229_06350 [Campylobacterota bacterium]